MKLITLLFLCLACIRLAGNASDYKLVIEPKWQLLPLHPHDTHQFEESCVLVGSITFKKKSKDAITLSDIGLSWQGTPLSELVGSLYQKTYNAEFKPVEENLICDGTWSKTKQVLKLHFDEEQILGVENIFYLVLTVPKSQLPVLKQGKFTVMETLLPEPYRVTTAKEDLSLALDALDCEIVK